MKKRKVEVNVEKHGRNWVNFERPPYCPECESKDIKHSISISRSDSFKTYSAQCVCLHCGCVFTLVRTEEEDKIEWVGNETDK